MTLVEITLLLFLVVDPFGNLPFVLAVLGQQAAAQYRLAIARETTIAFAILLGFALTGDRILQLLSLEQSSLAVSGGVILFLISLKMIFKSSSEIFEDRYAQDPFLVPIAMPAIAGPSAITTVIILRTREQAPLDAVLSALVLVFALTYALFLAGRRISTLLGPRGVSAMEKFMGLLLNLVAIDMMLEGTRDFLATQRSALC